MVVGRQAFPLGKGTFQGRAVKLRGVTKRLVCPTCFLPPACRKALVWVDCEMTGLGSDGGPGDDSLLEAGR